MYMRHVKQLTGLLLLLLLLLAETRRRSNNRPFNQQTCSLLQINKFLRVSI